MGYDIDQTENGAAAPLLELLIESLDNGRSKHPCFGDLRIEAWVDFRVVVACRCLAPLSIFVDNV